MKFKHLRNMNYLKYNFILTILLVIVNASLIKAQCGILPTVTVNVSGSTTICPTDSVILTAIPAGLFLIPLQIV